jgi:hypothetical protein
MWFVEMIEITEKSGAEFLACGIRAYCQLSSMDYGPCSLIG